MTHQEIDWRLSCHEEGDHRWARDCPHKQDARVHPYRCCLHALDDIRALVEEERAEINLELLGGPYGLRDLMDAAESNKP